MFLFSPLLRICSAMNDDNETVKALRSQIDDCATHLDDLKKKLIRAQQAKTTPNGDGSLSASISPKQPTTSNQKVDWRWPLDADEYKRYGRQMIIPEIGIDGCFKVPNHAVDGIANSIFA